MIKMYRCKRNEEHELQVFFVEHLELKESE